jgi:hypothetical protein
MPAPERELTACDYAAVLVSLRSLSKNGFDLRMLAVQDDPQRPGLSRPNIEAFLPGTQRGDRLSRHKPTRSRSLTR